MRTGCCYICGKELTGNIDFTHNVQCWVCSERKALYYNRVRSEEAEKYGLKGPWEASRGTNYLSPVSRAGGRRKRA